MRRWIITAALATNALLGALVLLKLWYQAGWGHAARLSSPETQLLIVVAVAAVASTLLLVPVLGISFWARDRGTRRLTERIATLVAGPRLPAAPMRTADADRRCGRGARGLRRRTGGRADPSSPSHPAFPC